MIILLFLLFILWVLMISIMATNLSKVKPKENSCPPHKWTYIDSGKMKCSSCGHVVGSEMNGL